MDTSMFGVIIVAAAAFVLTKWIAARLGAPQPLVDWLACTVMLLVYTIAPSHIG